MAGESRLRDSGTRITGVTADACADESRLVSDGTHLVGIAVASPVMSSGTHASLMRVSLMRAECADESPSVRIRPGLRGDYGHG